jgi:hypothetical protein
LPQSSADVQLRPDEFWAVNNVSFSDTPHTTSGVANAPKANNGLRRQD